MKVRYAPLLILLLLLCLPGSAVAEEAPLWTHRCGGTGVAAVAISGDGSTVCAAGEDGLVCLSEGGEVQWSSPLRMYDIALPDNGGVIVAGGFDLHTFAANGTAMYEDKIFNVIRSVAVSPDATRYLASTDGSTILEGAGWQEPAVERETGEDYLAVALVPGTDYFVAGTESGSVLLTAIGGATTFWEYRASKEPVNDIAAADGGRTIVVSTRDGMVHVLSRTGLLLWSAPASRPEGVAVSRDGECVAVADAQGIVFYDRTGIKLTRISVPSACTAVALTADATRAAVATDHDVSLYALDAGVVAAEGETPVATVSHPSSPDDDLAPVPSPIATAPSEADDPAVPTPTQAPAASLLATVGMVAALATRLRKNKE